MSVVPEKTVVVRIRRFAAGTEYVFFIHVFCLQSGPLSESKNTNFESVFKISRKTFSYISSLVKEAMMAKTSNFTDLNGKPLSINDQVAVALRRLSSGE